MEEIQENSLGKASSAYLQSARHQPVRWHEWSDEVFDKARSENKPVLLDIGAVWCHWCHVMDRESYEDPETADIINAKFIAVKVDRDERPDVDTRYQAAVSTISGQAGWPLTAFLTPEGNPYFGGTYFPPEERFGRPSFKRVLLTMANVFENKREEVNESAEGVLVAIEQSETLSASSESSNKELLGSITASIVSQFDSRNGGFGTQPKFPHSGAIDLLIDAASRGGSEASAAEHIVRTTLRGMAAGGIHDQLAGGFHRYSTDERWVVPHFEKMAYDNSELLKNYVHAFQTFLDPHFAEVARSIIRWMDESLTDQERGGFYSSQDADESLDDDGDYFTWTRAEARAVLTGAEFEAAAEYYNVRDVGDMRHNPEKNVLHISAALSADSVVQKDLIASAKKKLYSARLQRHTPYVDKTMYVGWNGMCISAFLDAARVLGAANAKHFALKSLDRLLASAWSGNDGLSRVIAYSTAGPSKRIPAVLDDYAFVAASALDAWESSGELKYFEAAKQIADGMLERFYDQEAGGFFDTQLGKDPIGVLRVKRKPLQDSPTPSGNATAVTVLLRLAALTNTDQYRTCAVQTLENFGGVVEHLGLYAASFGLTLRRRIEDAIQVCVIGDGEEADLLMAAATARFAVNKSIVRLTRDQLSHLPPTLSETLPHLAKVEGDFAVVCKGNACLPPIQNADKLAELLNADA